MLLPVPLSRLLDLRVSQSGYLMPYRFSDFAWARSHGSRRSKRNLPAS